MPLMNTGGKFNNNDANKCTFGAMIDALPEKVSGTMVM